MVQPACARQPGARWWPPCVAQAGQLHERPPGMLSGSQAARAVDRARSGAVAQPTCAHARRLGAKWRLSCVAQAGQLHERPPGVLSSSLAARAHDLARSAAVARPASLRAHKLVGPVPHGGSPAGHKLDNYASGLLGCCHTHATLTRSLALAQRPSQRACVRASSSAWCQMEALLRGKAGPATV